MCKFYIAVLVYEEVNVRIKDKKVKAYLQLIITFKNNFKITNLLSLALINSIKYIILLLVIYLYWYLIEDY